MITLGVGIGNLLQTGAGGSTLLVSSAAIGTDTIQGAMTTNDGTGNQVILATAGTANITGVTGFQTFRRNRGKTTGTAAFFSCTDSASWTLCIMCRRRPPFPR